MLVDMVVEVHHQTTLEVAAVVPVVLELHIKPQEQLVVDLVEMVFQSLWTAPLLITTLVVAVEWVLLKQHMKQVMVDKVVPVVAVVDQVAVELQVQMEEMLVKLALLEVLDLLDLLVKAQDQVVVVDNTHKDLVVMVDQVLL
tara:strand:+ start:677 stop:1102 length:426 start_codon:yes stop_codon:yes gene_type:complete